MHPRGQRWRGTVGDHIGERIDRVPLCGRHYRFHPIRRGFTDGYRVSHHLGHRVVAENVSHDAIGNPNRTTWKRSRPVYGHDTVPDQRRPGSKWSIT